MTKPAKSGSVKSTAVKRSRGQSLLSATRKSPGQAPVEKHESNSPLHTASVTNGELASAGVTLRHTKNLGNYESMTFGVQVTMPCDPDNIDGTMRLTQGIAEVHLQRIIREWMPGDDADEFQDS